MAIRAPSSSVFCLVCAQTALLLLALSSPGAAILRFPQHYTMMHWASRIEKELDKVLPQVTGAQQMRSICMSKPFRNRKNILFISRKAL
ncbi:hypothetical protein MHYP_G00336840 [Metynnis hypsauchen]